MEMLPLATAPCYCYGYGGAMAMAMLLWGYDKVIYEDVQMVIAARRGDGFQAAMPARTCARCLSPGLRGCARLCSCSCSIYAIYAMICGYGPMGYLCATISGFRGFRFRRSGSGGCRCTPKSL